MRLLSILVLMIAAGIGFAQSTNALKIATIQTGFAAGHAPYPEHHNLAARFLDQKSHEQLLEVMKWADVIRIVDTNGVLMHTITNLGKERWSGYGPNTAPLHPHEAKARVDHEQRLLQAERKHTNQPPREAK